MSRPKPHRLLRLLACGSVLLLALIVGIGPVRADSSDEDRAERIGAGDPARGALKARDAGCLGCHGAERNAVPRLEGQLAAYTLAQLERFASGQRSHPPLAVLAATDAEDIAAWFASAPAMPAAASTAVDAADSARLFAEGDRHRDVIACRSCHGPDGRGALSGSDSYPAIGGQSADYLRARLRSWRAGPPSGAPISVMNLVSRRLGDAEIDALSAWLAQLPPAH